MKTNTENIKAVYQLASAVERVDGSNWYPVAHCVALELADRYHVTECQAIGVIAALSPRNRWERNVHDAEALISAYVAAGAPQAMLTKVCTFTANKTKAIKILQAVDPTADEVRAILSGPKLKEFFGCILGSRDEICVDGHAYCIWSGGRTGLKDVPAIGVKLRREIKADYVKAAQALDVSPSVLQAITWIVWRRIHGVTK